MYRRIEVSYMGLVVAAVLLLGDGYLAYGAFANHDYAEAFALGLMGGLLALYIAVQTITTIQIVDGVLEIKPVVYEPLRIRLSDIASHSIERLPLAVALHLSYPTSGLGYRYAKASLWGDAFGSTRLGMSPGETPISKKWSLNRFVSTSSFCREYLVINMKDGSTPYTIGTRFANNLAAHLP